MPFLVLAVPGLIGVFAGALIRRTVPAMAAAVATWTVLDVVTMTTLRQRGE
ncbi:MAG: hypothetical protein ACLPKI_32785 [Streptosporangiaceae bacterium]